MAMTDEEVERSYRAKVDMVIEQGGTEMQLLKKAERYEAHPYRTGQ
jgi:hypothetical protein